MRKKAVYAVSVGFLIAVLAVITNTMLGYSQFDLQDSEKPANKRQFYGCGIYLAVLHCDPLRNKVEGYVIDATAKVVYDPSQFPFSGAVDLESISVEPRAVSKSNINNDDWQLVTVTWDEGILKFYRNGILEGSSERKGSLVTNTVIAQIGSGEQESTNVNYWKGTIDEVRIYDRVLTEHEMKQILAGESDAVSNGLVGYWPFDSNTNDFSGNNNHGTLYGTNDAFVDGVRRKALYFDGVDDHVDLSFQPSFSKALTFMAWIKLQTNPSDGAREIFNNNQFFLRIDPQSEGANRLAAFVKLVAPSSLTSYLYKGIIPSMVFAPDGRLFFTEKNTGNVRIMQDGKVIETPFVQISNFDAGGEHGILGLTLDPAFEQNHFLYLYYTYEEDTTGQLFNRVVRFVDQNNRGTDMVVLLDKIPANDTMRGHVGGGLGFGPDEKLYITVGDTWKPESAQDPLALTGKILRINRDGTIPEDNPFSDSPVYTIGHRNMFGIAFDNNGTGIVTENGQEHYDEINKIEKGGNYGWPSLQPRNIAPELSHASIKPLRSYWHIIAPAQVIHYNDDKIPELKGRFLFGAYVTGNLYALEFDENNEEIIYEEVINTNHTGPVISLAKSPDGSIYFAGTAIYKLEQVDVTNKEQILFTVEITGPVDVKDLQLYNNEKKMVIEINSNGSSSIEVKIPKVLLDGILTINDETQELDFTVDSSSATYNIVSLHIPSSGDSQIVVQAKTVIPEFPISTIAVTVSVFVLIVILAKIKFRN